MVNYKVETPVSNENILNKGDWIVRLANAWKTEKINRKSNMIYNTELLEFSEIMNSDESV